MAEKERPTILVVDDEPDVVGLLRFHLEKTGFRVLECSDGARAFEVTAASRPSLVVLDVMLPRLSGWEVCQLIKRHPELHNTPVLFLSAKVASEERVKGLSLGADDYVTKPFSPAEIILRVRALLARSSNNRPAVRSRFPLGDGYLQLDFDAYQFTRAGEPVRLTSKEARILKVLVEHLGRVVKIDDLLKLCWSDGIFVETGNIHVHIRHLREKLEPTPAKPRYIMTIRGAGYRFQWGNADLPPA